jgi:predicted DNA-binding protein YlxM (UPF0122 family)
MKYLSKKPKTITEAFVFQNNSINEILRNLTDQLEGLKQIVARGSDALYEYEKVLKTIAKHGEGACKSDAKWVLKRHKIK